MKASRKTGHGLAIAILITLATAVTSHMIGHGPGVPHAITDGFQASYYVAVALAATAAIASLVLLPKAADEGHRGPRSVRIAVAFAAVLVCFIGTDFAVGLSYQSPIGAYSSRRAYTFVSAPTLHPPLVQADVTQSGRSARGDIFIANLSDPSHPAMLQGQSGPLILDQRLSPVWFEPVPENDLASNLSLQTYEGRPVLAWWQGVVDDAGMTESGEYLVVDQHYRVVARLHGADGWTLTLHEIVIRGNDAWVTATKNVTMDLSRYGSASRRGLIDSAVQEYNLETGQLVRSWDALAHIPLSESWAPMPRDGFLWDAYHANSIELVGRASFVVSMRNTWAAYKVDIATGRIVWTLGGKQSSFRRPGADFQWQHNVMVYRGTPLVTLFDDHCCEVTDAGTTLSPTGPSRGLVLKVNPATHTATLADQYTRGASFESEYMGSMQPLPDGNVFVGWGSQGRFSEYSASGRLVLDAVLPSPDMSYRATVEPWVGLPLYPPSGAARQRDGKTIVYASWNGATEVVSWRVLAGPSSGALVPATAAAKVGFETSMIVPGNHRRFRVQALNARGNVIGNSASFTTGG